MKYLVVIPGWQFDPNSKLRASMIQIYKEMFGKDVQVEALHAGLECGIMTANDSRSGLCVVWS